MPLQTGVFLVQQIGKLNSFYARIFRQFGHCGKTHGNLGHRRRINMKIYIAMFHQQPGCQRTDKVDRRAMPLPNLLNLRLGNNFPCPLLIFRRQFQIIRFHLQRPSMILLDSRLLFRQCKLKIISGKGENHEKNIISADRCSGSCRCGLR